MIKVGSDFSGVGAFDQALRRLNIDYKTVFSCDMDLFARESYMANYGEPAYYPFDVYEREIPKQSLDIYMTSPPCQAFSMAGNRKGEDDKRGVLFYNSHEFIVKNKPRYFIFENVKGLLSDAKGRTFQIWLDMLGGKSVNGNPVIFPREDATPYHIYHKVLNAKNYGVPQNRERVFIIGIRDDADNNFHWPKKQPLKKRLKDVLEVNVDKKFYLSDEAIQRLCYNESGFISEPKNDDDIASTVCASDYKIARGMNVLKVKPELKTVLMGAIRGRNPEQPKSRVVGLPTEQRLELNMNGTSNALTTVQKDNVVVCEERNDEGLRFFKGDVCGTIRTIADGGDKRVIRNQTIRRLTPRECFRLMDFPDSFEFVCSNSQLYKQAGNSIVVNVLAEILKKLNL